MTMTFTPSWASAKLAVIPDPSTLPALRLNMSATQQKKAGIHPSSIAYAEENNRKRSADSIFLTVFNETDVRRAVQRGQASFNKNATIKSLLGDMIGATVATTVDQGTHQAEDSTSGGYKLHFDVRRADNLCFHFYVGQDEYGILDITEISYMDAGTHVSLAANG